MLLSALKYTTLKVLKNMTVFMSMILILRRFTEMGLFFPSLKAHNLVKDLGFRYGIPKSP